MSQNLSFKMLERYNHSMEKKDNDEINTIDIEHGLYNYTYFITISYYAMRSTRPCSVVYTHNL